MIWTNIKYITKNSNVLEKYITLSNDLFLVLVQMTKYNNIC